MLEEVAGEDDVDAVIGHAAEVRRRRADHRHIRRRVGRLWIEVDGDLPAGDDVVDELAMAGSHFEHCCAGIDVRLKEAAAEDAPYLIAERSIAREAALVCGG